MEARVNQSSRYGAITAFSGCEYVKYEWRVVPAGKEEEAAKHPHLEVKQIGMDVLNSLPSFSEPVELKDAGKDFEIPLSYTDPQPETITEIVEMEVVPEPEPQPKPRKRGKK